jgi:hypothetical protein
LAASISAIIASSAALSKARTGLASMAARRRSVVGLRRTDRDDVGQHLDAERLAQKRPGDRSGRDPGSGLTGTGAFQHRPGVVESVFEHAGVVGVAGPRPGERRIASDIC